ncbi:hypothetical protein Adt_11721 [Abeliophyllum distichum]|uniref:Flotillin-like n=1 Tax=Abeliophyllum distichum TaxID=126358 RepID=A0ABD1UNR6_9LAMI
MIAEKDRQLVEAREKVEKVKAEQTKAEAKAMMSYKEEAPNTPEYLQLANLFLTADGEQLVQTRMGHFIPYLCSCRPSLLREFFGHRNSLYYRPQDGGEVQIISSIVEEGPQCASSREAAGQ